MPLTFGLEIELAGVGVSQMETAMRNAGMRVGRYGDRQQADGNYANAWTVKTEHCGIEVVSPIITSLDDVRAQAQMLDRAARAVRGRAAQGCGFHVHIGGFNREDRAALARIGLRFAHYEPVMDLMMARYRRGNAYRFARSNRAHLISRYGSLQSAYTRAPAAVTSWRNAGNVFHSSGRYMKLNFDALMRHGTVEFRAPQSELRWENIYGYAAFYAQFMQATLAAPALVSPPEQDEPLSARFAKMMRGVDSEVRAWALSRMRRRNPTNVQVQTMVLS